jgi:hypothetical protein
MIESPCRGLEFLQLENQSDIQNREQIKGDYNRCLANGLFDLLKFRFCLEQGGPLCYI